MASALCDHTIVIRCDNLADYNLALQRLALWNLNDNHPLITINPFLHQLRINVVYAQHTVQF